MRWKMQQLRRSSSLAGHFRRGKKRRCKLAARFCGGLCRISRDRVRRRSQPHIANWEIWAQSRERCCLLKASGRTGVPARPTIQLIFREIAAARGPAAKGILVRKLLSEVSPLEAKYLVKIMTGDLRIGLKESLVEEAIAKAFDGDLKAVQRANMLLGDIGETLRLAAEHKLA